MFKSMNSVLDLLSEEFEAIVELFPNDDWKFFKFGKGGPYNDLLCKLQDLADAYDKQIILRFLGKDEINTITNQLSALCSEGKLAENPNKQIATFRQIIAICLVRDEKEIKAVIEGFRNNIARMKKEL